MNEELDPQFEASRPPLPAESISRRILTVRCHRVMLDADLAELYGVPTSRLNEAVKRNSIRFPVDFMFRLSAEEYTALISQIAISKPGRRGGRRKLPYVFTEQGVAIPSGSGATLEHTRKDVRREVPRRVRCDSRPDGTAQEPSSTYRILTLLWRALVRNPVTDGIRRDDAWCKPKKGATVSRNPLIVLVAGPGFEPGTFGRKPRWSTVEIRKRPSPGPIRNRART